ncbi:MAG TPA: vWA domain-containing protein, partial [bacterium]|nr:vWA domain-containing protein [bacterium]
MEIKINTELGVFNIFLIFFLFIIIVFILYKTVFLKNNKLIFLLDFFSAILLLSIILQIEITLKIKKREKSNLVILIDTSLSMSIEENGKKRFDTTKEILKKYSKRLKKYKPVFYTFGSSLKKIEEKDIEKLKVQDEETNILKNILKIREINKNNKISGILLFSDGIETSSTTINDLKNIEIPVYTIVSRKSDLKDISIDRVTGSQYIYKGEKNKIEVFLKSSNFRDKKVKINLKKNNKTLDSKIIEVKEENQKVEFEIISENSGYEIYEIEVISDEKELNNENNRKNFVVMNISPLIKVLYIEGYLRWEYKFLKNFLEGNPNIESISIINIGKQTYQQTGGKEFNFQGSLFEKKSDFENFHIIILGDIDFSGFSKIQMKNIEEIVNNGSNIIFLGGKNFL